MNTLHLTIEVVKVWELGHSKYSEALENQMLVSMGLEVYLSTSSLLGVYSNE